MLDAAVQIDLGPAIDRLRHLWQCSRGTTSFADLQDRIARGKTDDLVFFAFDLLYRDGYDLTGATLEDRKAALAEIVPRDVSGMVRYSDHQQGRGPDFLRHACKYELEGIISKRRDKPYRPGRGTDWLKVKCLNNGEFIVVGFTEPNRSRAVDTPGTRMSIALASICWLCSATPLSGVPCRSRALLHGVR